MKYCMNLLLWTGEVTEETLPVIEQLKQMGYDGVELPMFEGGDIERYEKLGKQLDDLGLGRTAVTIVGGENNPISPDAAVRQKGVESVQLGARYLRSRRRRNFGRSVSFSNRRIQRSRANRGRVELGHREHA